MITTGAMPDIEQDLAEIVPFWGNLDLSQRAFLAQRSRRMKFDAGSHVQGAGAGCAGVVFVRSGRLRAFMLSDQGREVTLFYVQPGECCVLAASCILPMITFDIALDAAEDSDRAFMLSDQGREVTLFYVQPGECCVLAASCILPMITFDIALDAAEDSDLLIIDSQAFGTVSQENIHAEAFTYRQATERFSDCMWVMQQVLFMGLDTGKYPRRGVHLSPSHRTIQRLHVGHATGAVHGPRYAPRYLVARRSCSQRLQDHLCHARRDRPPPRQRPRGRRPHASPATSAAPARPSAACSNTSPERDSSNSHAARSSSSMSSAYAF